MKAFQLTTGAGLFGIFNQLFILFKDLHWGEILPHLSKLTIEESLMAFGPILVFIYFCVFDEEKHHRIKEIMNKVKSFDKNVRGK